MMITKRYEHIDEKIIEIREERTTFLPYMVTGALNGKEQHIKDLRTELVAVRRHLAAAEKRIAELEDQVKQTKDSEDESNKIRNRQNIEVTEALRDALGDQFDVGVTTPGLVHALAKQRDEYKSRIAELEAAPAVTPEWLAETMKNALQVNAYGERWESTSEHNKDCFIAAAARVIQQMPKAAPAVVDVKKLIEDYHAHRSQQGLESHLFFKGILKKALEAQGISCK